MSAAASGLIVVGIRWVDRLIGLISTIVLSRILSPADFGIVAMASLVIGLIEVLLDMGVNISLIQNKDADQEDFNSAWTLRLLQAFLASLILLLLATPASGYFGDARLIPVIQVLALSVVVVAFENIGIVTFQKKMQFVQEFRFFFLKRLVGFVVTIGAAIYLKSYWALIIGTLSLRLAGVVLSYWLHPMRPRLSFARFQGLLSFSMWNMLRSVANYMNENVHTSLVARRETTDILGTYSMASEVASLPSTELLSPLSRVLFPLFVNVKNDLQELKRVFLLAVGVQALIGVPAGVGLAIVAPELVKLMLGEKWLAAVPFVQILGFTNIVIAVSTSGAYALISIGRVNLIAIFSWVQLTLFVLLIGAFFPTAGAMGIAQARAFLASFAAVAFVIFLSRSLPSLKLRELLTAIWRPCLGSIMMAWALQSFGYWPAQPLILVLAAKCLSGALVLVLSDLVLWQLSGRPAGAEAYFLENLRGMLARLRRQK